MTEYLSTIRIDLLEIQDNAIVATPFETITSDDEIFVYKSYSFSIGCQRLSKFPLTNIFITGPIQLKVITSIWQKVTHRMNANKTKQTNRRLNEELFIVRNQREKEHTAWQYTDCPVRREVCGLSITKRWRHIPEEKRSFAEFAVFHFSEFADSTESIKPIFYKLI